MVTMSLPAYEGVSMLSAKQPAKPGNQRASAKIPSGQVMRTPMSVSPELALGTCPCGGGCPRCERRQIADPQRDTAAIAVSGLEQLESGSGMPMPQTLRTRMEHAFAGKTVVSAQRPATGIALRRPSKTTQAEIGAEDSVEERQAEEVAEQITAQAISADSEPPPDAPDPPDPRPRPSFAQVRIHADAGANALAERLRARAFAYRNHIVFARGEYAPEHRAGMRVLGHELTHVLQHEGATQPRISRLPEDEAAAPGLDTRSFATLWGEFERHRDSGRDDEALALVDALLARISPDEALTHAGELALWLLRRDEDERALRALSALENAWWIAYAADDLPTSLVGGLGMPVGPEALVERGEVEAGSGNAEIAQRLLGIAHLMVQMLLDRINRRLQADREQYAGLGDAGQSLIAVAEALSASEFERLTELRTRILNVYPGLAAAARASGDTEAAAGYDEAGSHFAASAASGYTLSEMHDLSSMSTPIGRASMATAGVESPLTGLSGTTSIAGGPAPQTEGAEVTEDAEGAEASVSAESAQPAAPPIGGAETDRVVEGVPPFENGTALALPGNHYVSVRSDRYAVSESLARAVAWAQNLFGVNSSVVAMHYDDDRTIRYYAAALDEDLSESMPAATPMQRVRVPQMTPLEELPHDYHIMVVHVGNGVGFWPTEERLEGFYNVLARQAERTPDVGNLDRELVRERVFSRIDVLMQDVDENREEIADLLAELDYTAFSTLSLEQRSAYLDVLLRAWTFQAEERAVVEIMRSVGSETELRAIIARLRADDLWESLIDDLDHELWSLLVTVGQRFGGEGFTMGDVYRIMVDADLLSIDTPIPGLRIGPDGPEFEIEALAQLDEAANGFLRTAESFWDAIVMVVTHPDRIVEGLAQLTKMLLVFELARLGYVPAMVLRQQILDNIGRQILDGLKGTAVLGVGEEVLRRIKWALIWEIASFFVGIGEIHAALGAISVSARAGALARFLRVLRLVGHAAEGERAIGSLSRLAGILGRSSRVLRSEEEVLVALSHLPEEEAASLGRALDGIDLPEGMTLSQLRTAQPALAAVADASLQRAEVLQRLAAKMGGYTDEATRVFARLSGGGHPPAELMRLVALIPEGEGARFARALAMIGDDAALSGARGLSNLEAIAASAYRMQGIERYGFRAFEAMMERSGRDAARVDEYLAALNAIDGEMTSAERATRMGELVSALERGEADAFARLESRMAHPSATPSPAPAAAVPEAPTPGGGAVHDAPTTPDAPATPDVPATPSPAAAAPADPYAGVSIPRLRRLARTDPEAAEALRLRYRGMSDARLERYARTDPAAESVYAGRRVVAPEARGQGRFSRPEMEGRLAGDVRSERARLEAMGIERRTPDVVNPDIEAEGGTIGVARTDIPGLEDAPIIGRSPQAGGQVNPTSPIAPPTDPVLLPHTHGHAEQGIGDELIERLNGVDPATLRGRRVWMMIEQVPCSACAQGIENLAVEPGVLGRLSRLFPEVVFEVRSMESTQLIVLHAGRRIN